jgi:Protein of unknown function (DUF2891)
VTGFTRELAERFARLALAHIEREFPNKLDHVLSSAQDARTPQELHPVFFGSFDWHSCVHGYWLLARTLRRHSDISSVAAITKLFARRFTPESIAAECAYLDRPHSRAFERPYGWGWLLALQSELDCAAHPTLRASAATLRPLADAFADRFEMFLPLADYPIRSGAHFSTAFALRMAADFAEKHRPTLFAQMQGRAKRWYGNDRAAQAWEPSLDDFLSPTLIEAECMRRLLPPSEFHDWFARFLPRFADREPRTLFTPATVSDRSDGKIAHLDGLNLSRAWCWRSLAVACRSTNKGLAAIMSDAADAHLAASLGHVAGHYEGEHWLATFAALAHDSPRGA